MNKTVKRTLDHIAIVDQDSYLLVLSNSMRISKEIAERMEPSHLREKIAELRDALLRDIDRAIVLASADSMVVVTPTTDPKAE